MSPRARHRIDLGTAPAEAVQATISGRFPRTRSRVADEMYEDVADPAVKVPEAPPAPDKQGPAGLGGLVGRARARARAPTSPTSPAPCPASWRSPTRRAGWARPRRR